MTNKCHSCGADEVFHVFNDGDDQITIKFPRNGYEKEMIEIMIRDGNYDFKSARMDLRDYDRFIRDLLEIRKTIKLKIQQNYGDNTCS